MATPDRYKISTTELSACIDLGKLINRFLQEKNYTCYCNI